MTHPPSHVESVAFVTANPEKGPNAEGEVEDTYVLPPPAKLSAWLAGRGVLRG